jgi:uncharacterized protein
MDSPTTVNRHPERGKYDTETIYSILDEAYVCTVSFVVDERPVAIPTIHARVENMLYLHGSPASRMMTSIAGAPVCVTATLVDGLVLARSVFNHSMNYRSVVLFGQGRLVQDREEKVAAMRAVTEHVLPGRWDEVRQPNAKEIAGTQIVAVPIDQASAKVRAGAPIDDEGDEANHIWSGVIPLILRAGAPIADRPELATPQTVLNTQETGWSRSR